MEATPTLGEKIAAMAKTYIGKTEIPPNAGFTDKQFEADMKLVGWYVGGNWCAFFCILIWWKCLTAASFKYFFQFASGNALEMYHKCHASRYMITGIVPKVGAIAIYREGNSETVGHADLVVEVIDEKHFYTVDGNSNTNGSRNGYEVAPHSKTLGLPFNPAGLNFVGFIYPLGLAA